MPAPATSSSPSPLVLGHEIAGVVEAVGAGRRGPRARRPGRGQPVPLVRRTAPRCAEGRANLCENIYFMGSASKTPHMQGGFADRVRRHAGQCVKVPDDVPLEAAALAEPLAVCLHAVARAATSTAAGRGVGAGPIGLLTLLAARLKGAASVAVVDIAAAPLAFATELGADAVVDLSADADGLARLAAARRRSSRFPAPPPASPRRSPRLGAAARSFRSATCRAARCPCRPTPVMAKELDLRGSFRFGREFAEAVGLIADGAVDVARPRHRPPPARRRARRLPAGARPLQSVKVLLTAG